MAKHIVVPEPGDRVVAFGVTWLVETIGSEYITVVNPAHKEFNAYLAARFCQWDDEQQVFCYGATLTNPS